MDIEPILSDSFAYAQEALVGKWTRWAIFILLALPFSLIRFIFNPENIRDGMKMNWAAVPWGQIVALVILGILLSFFLSGYMVRIYRGIKPAPDFTGWTELFVDGLKLAIVWFLWVLPIFIVLAAGIAIAVTTFLSNQAISVSPNWVLLVPFVVLFLLVECILIIFVALFGILGAVRFARTGSIREGVRASAILVTIRTMGWVSYIISLIVFVVIAVAYGILSMFLSFIPYIGWVLVLIIAPFFSIFFARYFTRVYDHGEPQPFPTEVPPEVPPVVPFEVQPGSVV